LIRKEEYGSDVEIAEKNGEINLEVPAAICTYNLKEQ